MTALLTLAQVCARVQLSPWAVRRAIGRGELVAYKLAGRLRIPEEALDDWLRAGVMQPVEVRSAPTRRPREPSQHAGSFRERLRKESDHERAPDPAL